MTATSSASSCSLVVTKLLLLLGLAVLVAATPLALPDQNDDCKKAGQIAPDGQIACDAGLPCPTTGHICRTTKWHENVGDPFIYYCSCTNTDQFSGEDPTTGLCMAYSVKNGNGWLGKCSSGGCGDNQKCEKDSGHYKKCTCQPR